MVSGAGVAPVAVGGGRRGGRRGGGGELHDAAQEGDGGGEFGGRGGADGPLGAEALGQRLLQRDREHLREPLVRHRGQRRPGRPPVPYEEERAARVDEGGDGAGGVTGDELPDALAQRDLGQLALGAQPLLDVGEGEGGAGLRTADGLGEVGVTAAPVADGRPADPRETGDARGGHLCCAVGHLPQLPSLPCV
ncbi:hypothetical protein GCM10019017_48770 [Streptomyces showdoensis]